MIRLSIISVTWNCKAYVREFLQSLGNLLLDPTVQILILDNNSADGTADMIQSEFPMVTLIRNNDNLGFARACNQGLKLAKGDLIALINPDVRVMAGCLDKMMEWMTSHPRIGLLGPQMLGDDGLVHRSTMRLPTAWKCFCHAMALDNLFSKSTLFRSHLTKDFDHNETREVEVLNGWFWMTRRKALDEVGLLDESFFMYGEDIDWSKRFHDAGWQEVFFAGASSVHVGGGSSSNSPVFFYVQEQRTWLQYFKKHHSVVSQLGFVVTLWLHHVLRIIGHGTKYLVPSSNHVSLSLKIRRSAACIRWLLGFSP